LAANTILLEGFVLAGWMVLRAAMIVTSFTHRGASNWDCLHDTK